MKLVALITSLRSWCDYLGKPLMAVITDYYEILGISQDATPEEIRRAYHEAARRHHPDSKADLESTELFLQIQKAYETLSNPISRTEFDAKLEAEGGGFIRKNFIFSRSVITPIQEPQLFHALLEFSARADPQKQPVPSMNLCLIIDRSTSMQGERMDMIKNAAIELVRLIRPEDYFSIVTFNDRAEVLANSARHTDRASIETQIRMIRPSGGTEIYQGLEAGFKEVSLFSSQCFTNHIILLTDGRTYGDEQDCLRLADNAVEKGIRITILGIGTDWNDIFIDELAGRTGGSTSYVSRSKDITNFLKEKLLSLMSIFAEKVSFRITTEPGIDLNYVFRLQPEAAHFPKGALFQLGSIPSTQPLSLLLEFQIQPVQAAESRLTLAKGELEMLLIQETVLPYRFPIRLTRPVGEVKFIGMPPKQIFQALSLVNLFRMQERARQEAMEGKPQEASQRLHRLATHLLAMGETELAQTAIMEAERISQTSQFSPEGEKLLKYGSKGLFLPSRIKGSD